MSGSALEHLEGTVSIIAVTKMFCSAAPHSEAMLTELDPNEVGWLQERLDSHSG